MIAHFESIHINPWDVVENANRIPYDVELNEVPQSQWMKEQKQRFLLNSKARNALLCVLFKDEYTKVQSFRSAKIDVGHTAYNIWMDNIGKEERAKSPHT